MKFCKGLVIYLAIPSVFAWNAQGHIIVAKLTQQYLSSNAKVYVQYIQDTEKMGGKPSSLADTAIWMDKFYSPKYRFLRKCHYVTIPEGDKRYFPKKKQRYDALFAIEYAKQVLRSSASSREEKAFAMRVLVHVVADIHQPLHTISWYSAQFPSGDRGGNLIKIKPRKLAKNLHAFWDKGGGWLDGHPENTEQKLKELVYQPCSGTPKDWVNRSHEIAKMKAYRFNGSTNYVQDTQNISKIQLQQAACHLAMILESLAYSPSIWA